MTSLLAHACVYLLAWGGFTLLALAMDRHHRQMRPASRPCPRRSRPCLRLGGAMLLALSLAAAIRVAGPTTGPVLWVAILSAAALTLIVLLAWRPRWALYAGAGPVPMVGLVAGLALIQ